MLINILFHPVYKGEFFEFNLSPISNDWSYVRKACNSLVWAGKFIGGCSVITVAEIYIGRFRVLRTSNSRLIKVLKKVQLINNAIHNTRICQGIIQQPA